MQSDQPIVRLRAMATLNAMQQCTVADWTAACKDSDHRVIRWAIESMAKQVVNVWMLSQYRVETADKKGDAAPAFDAGYFEKGFIWPAIKAHPIGFSHSGHGYWTTKP